MINQALIQRIVYAKYLYWQGCETLDKGLPVSSGLSILNFQDSAEMYLRVIAEHVHANIREKTSFDQLIDEIENKSSIRIPYRSSLIQLNKARVSFKHFGLIPSSDDAQKFRRDLNLFYGTTTKDVFKIEFYDISLTDLIQKCRVRNYLREAEKEFAEKNFRACIRNATIAFSLIFRRKLSHDKPPSIPRIEIRNHDMVRALGTLPNVVTVLTSTVNEHEEEINILMFGINLAEYHRFKLYAPHVNISAAGNVMETISKRSLDDTFEDAIFCLRFVTDAALLVQQNRVPDDWEEYYKNKLLRYRVIEKAPILISPGEYSELIRYADVGEELLGYFGNKNDNEYIAILFDDEIAHIKSIAIKEIQESR